MSSSVVHAVAVGSVLYSSVSFGRWVVKSRLTDQLGKTKPQPWQIIHTSDRSLRVSDVEKPIREWYDVSAFRLLFNAILMVDYRIILQILHSHLLECAGNISLYETKEWISDKQMIVFPITNEGYHERIGELNPLQFMQRTRILYTMLSFPN
jgi:hypothetical protein